MCDSTQKCKDNEMELKLKKYEILYTAYADEIRNLWQRSIFLGAFMVLVWTGYGALQLKAIEKCANDSSQNIANIAMYNYASLGLCFVIIVLSLLWIAMAKGSKFVQEAHEAHIAKYNEVDWLFCDLGKYQNGCYDADKIECKKKSTRYPLGAFRFSPSRINIALGWFSAIISLVLGVVHTIIYLNLNIFDWYQSQWVFVVIIAVLLILAFALIYYPSCLNGGISKKHKKEK